MTADYDVCIDYFTMSRSQRKKHGGGVTSTEGELNYFWSSYYLDLKWWRAFI